MKKKITFLVAMALALTASAASPQGSALVKKGMVPESAVLSAAKSASSGMTGFGPHKKRVVSRAPEGGYSLPFDMVPTVEQFSECTVIDSNGDGKTWTWDSTNGFKYSFHGSNNGDDWLILPAVAMEAGEVKLLFDYKANSSSYTETFEVYIGSAPTVEGMTQKLGDFSSNSTEYQSGLLTFSVPSAGNYYVAFHATSPKNAFYLFVKNVAMRQIDNSLPALATILSAEMDATECSLSVKLPAKNIGGADLTGTVGAEVRVDGEVVATDPVMEGAPGSTVSTTLSLESGRHTISVTAYDYNDGVKRFSESVEVQVIASRKVPVALPAYFEPDAVDFEICTVVDANNSGKTWGFADSGNNGNRQAFRYTYEWSYDGDDYIILPAITAAASGAYELSYDVSTKFDNESYEVYWGSSADVASMTKIFESGDFKTSDNWEGRKHSFSGTTEGNIFIAFRATSPRNRSYIYISRIKLAEADPTIPAAPEITGTDFNGGDGTINILMPSVTVSGASIAQSQLYLGVRIDGTAVGEPLTAAPGATVAVPVTGLSLGNHTVEADVWFERDGANVTSEAAKLTFKVSLPDDFAYELPATMALNSTDKDNYTVFDMNGDGSTWSYDSQNDCFKYTYNSSNTGDDWLFTPAVNITDVSEILRVAISARCGSGTESYEIYLGSQPNVASMTVKIMESEIQGRTNFEDYYNDFVLDTPGKYYVGIHASSPVNQYWLYVKNLRISSTGNSPLAPGAVTDLAVTPDPTGLAQATLSFTMPVVNMVEGQLDAAATLTATAVCGTHTASVTGLPGESKELVIETDNGECTFTVSVANANGSGRDAIVTARCGLDRPKAPVLTGAVTSADNMSVTITWEAVTEGVNGGVANPGAMRYRIYEYDYEDEDWYHLEDTDQLTYTYTPGADAPQDLYVIGIDAYNAVNSGSSMSVINVNLGKPYTLPMSETFADGEFHYEPVALSSSLSSDYAPQWGLGNPINEGYEMVNNSGYAMIGKTQFNRGDSRVNLPRFATTGYNLVEVSMSVYVYEGTPSISVYAYSDDQDTADLLGEVSTQGLSGWNTFSFRLPSHLTGREWVNAYAYVNFSGSSQRALIESYEVKGEQVQPSVAHGYQMGDTNYKFGFVEFGVEDFATTTIVKATTQGGSHVSAGEAVNGKYYTYTVVPDPFGALDAENFVVYNIGDNEYTPVTTVANAEGRRVVDMTYDYTNNTMYALVETRVGNGPVTTTALHIVDPETGEYTLVGSAGELTAINGHGREVETVLVTLAADAQGNLYAMSDLRQFYRIDKFTGAAIRIGTTQHSYATNNQFQSMAFDRMGELYWAQQHPDEGRFLTVNPLTGEPSLLGKLGADAQVTGLYFEKPYDTASPLPVTSLTAITGETEPNRVTLSWTLPEQDAAGNNVSITAVKVYRFGTSTPLATLDGSAVSYVDEAAPNGNLTYYVTTVAGEHAGAPALTGVFAGCDMLNAVTDLSLTAEGRAVTLTWNAPTATVNGGYADFDNITYKVVRVKGDTRVVLDEACEETTYTDLLVVGGTYSYEVIPVCGGVEGVTAQSEEVTVDITFSVPYETGFEDDQDGTLWTTILGAHHTSANNGWSITSGSASQTLDGKFAQLKTQGSADYADDWLISPAIHLDADILYNLAYFCHGGIGSDDHSFEVYIGTDPTDISTFTQKIAEYEDVRIPTDWSQQNVHQFVVDNAGNYHIGFHGSTTETYANLRIDNLSLKADESGIDNVTAGSLRIVNQMLFSHKEIASFSVMSTSGREVAGACNVNATVVSLGLGNVPAGVYLVKVTFTNGSVATLKTLK